MLLKRNLLETTTLISCSGSVVCVLLNLISNISPLKGVWFTVYAFLVFFVSLCLSFRFIQWFLHLNKPLKYDFQHLVIDYPYLSPLIGVIPKPKVVTWDIKEYDTNELSVITTVLERKLVSSWYVPFVSQEIGFPFACKQLLDQIVGKAFQISNKIDTKQVYIDTCAVLTIHLKEYKKAVKKQEKSPEKSIESLYNNTHFTSEKNYTSTDHCINILRIVLKELVPWELWDTPHSELLIRILAKRLDSYIDSTLSDPVWLNHKLLEFLKAQSNETKQEIVKGAVGTRNETTQNESVEKSSDNSGLLEKSNEKSENENDLSEKSNNITEKSPESQDSTPKKQNNQKTTVETALSTIITKSTAPILQRPLNGDEFHCSEDEEMSELRMNGSGPVEIQSLPVMRQRRGRQGRNEVKIYDRVVEGSVKTWESSSDLQCVSLGTDLLNDLGDEITLSRLWGTDDDGSADQLLWFGEEDTLDLELDSKEASPIKKETKDSSLIRKETKETSPVRKDTKETSPKPELSPKPTEALLKDLQSTVHQAKTKIGDLQVPDKDLDVNHDEAAGMMEGLLDFGIAGFRKGLRFTGLSDESDKSPKETSSDKYSPPNENKQDIAVSGNAQKVENGVGSAPPLLVKQQRVASQDSVVRPVPLVRPPPLPPLQPPESPEPEYEEAADLSTSIAKLRCLLQQRERNEGREAVWWEGAEETRGRERQRSERPCTHAVDSATLADEYDPSSDRNSSPNEQATNNMQRLDKFLNRAVTGVFNSIMTAVGADSESGAPKQSQQWDYLTNDMERSVGNCVARLVGSRRAYNHVDSALDSLEQLPQSKHPNDVTPDDFEEWCSVRGVVWRACAELSVAAAGGTHAAVTMLGILLADVTDSLITTYLSDLTCQLRRQVFATFEQLNEQLAEPELELAPFDVDHTCEVLLEALPGMLQVFGTETLSNAIHLVVSSFSRKEVNKVVIANLLDIAALHFKNAASVRHPSFDHQ